MATSSGPIDTLFVDVESSSSNAVVTVMLTHNGATVATSGAVALNGGSQGAFDITGADYSVVNVVAVSVSHQPHSACAHTRASHDAPSPHLTSRC